MERKNDEVRQKFNASFKAKVALEALREEASVPELAKRRASQPDLRLESQVLDNAASLFVRGAASADANEKRDRETARTLSDQIEPDRWL